MLGRPLAELLNVGRPFFGFFAWFFLRFNQVLSVVTFWFAISGFLGSSFLRFCPWGRVCWVLLFLWLVFFLGPGGVFVLWLC